MSTITIGIGPGIPLLYFSAPSSHPSASLLPIEPYSWDLQSQRLGVHRGD